MRLLVEDALRSAPGSDASRAGHAQPRWGRVAAGCGCHRAGRVSCFEAQPATGATSDAALAFHVEDRRPKAVASSLSAAPWADAPLLAGGRGRQIG